MWDMKDTLVSCRPRTKIAKNQIQNLILQLIELKQKLNFQSHRESTLKVRALIKNEWGPVN